MIHVTGFDAPLTFEAKGLQDRVEKCVAGLVEKTDVDPLVRTLLPASVQHGLCMRPCSKVA